MRTKQIRLIKCLCRDCHLDADEETRRLFYARLTGKRTLSDMTDKQLGRVIDALKVQPRIAVKGGPTYQGVVMAQSPMSRKIRALWLELRDAGALTDSSEAALKNFVKVRTGTDDLDLLAPHMASNLIEQLKAWAERIPDRTAA